MCRPKHGRRLPRGPWRWRTRSRRRPRRPRRGHVSRSGRSKAFEELSLPNVTSHPPVIRERRRSVAVASAGPSFSRGLWRIASADVSSGNRVQLLHDGPETFDEMLQLIHDARTSVALESYIFRSDEVGARFAD